MLDAKRIHSLPKIPPPVLTAYLDTNPANSRNQGHPPGYIIWLKSRAKVLGIRLQPAERKQWQEQIARVEDFLRNERPQARGAAIFAGPKTWEVLPLQVEVEDELHWGRPSLTQLLWLLDEHQPCGVVSVDRGGARFHRFWLGEVEEQRKERFEIDITEWRKKHFGAPAHPKLHKTRGALRDVFEQRVEAQFARFYRESAERIHRWAESEKLDPVFLAGPNEVVEPVWAELPRAFQLRAALVKGDFAHLSAAGLQERIAPEVARWKRAHELEIVTRMLANPNGTRAVAGLDSTLLRLQEGMARELVVTRRLGGRLRQCANCGWTDRSADRECAACGGPRRVVPLRAAIPELARRYGVPVEVVAGEAGRRLREHGGIGAWLR